MTDQDLDFSGFAAERKVDVPPPRKKKVSSDSEKPKPESKKGKKKRAAVEKPLPVTTPTKHLDPQPVPVKPRKPAVSSKPANSSTPGRKKRVNVSLPVELSQRFTEKAAKEDRYLTDMVLDAYRDHFAAMRDEYLAEQGDADLPFRPRRRKVAAGRVTHMLYLAAPEIAVIDGSAVEIGRSRSELVSQLLERELA